MKKSTNYFTPLIKLFEENSNSENAIAMQKYMKERFSYYGIKSPLRKELQKKFIDEYGKLPIDSSENEIREVWCNCNRELNYSIIDIIRHKRYWQNENSIDFVEWLIENQSWWDSVDAIAVNCVGQYMKMFPENIRKYNAKWITSDNMWLNRTAIIFQLKYKEKTDFEMLKNNIRYHSHQKEFFVKKAIGWALREYSKTNPLSVIKFIDKNELQPLSIREASKYL